MVDDAESLHSEDVERGEVLVNKRVILSGETKLGQRRSLFHISESARVNVVMLLLMVEALKTWCKRKWSQS